MVSYKAKKCRTQMHIITYFLLLLFIGPVLSELNFNALKLKNLDKNTQVLAIDISYGSIALGCLDSIFIYDTNEKNLSDSILLGVVAIPTPISNDGYLELKLLSSHQVVYCDNANCRICTVTKTKASCSTLDLKLNGKELTNLENAVVTHGKNDRLFLRVVQKDESMSELNQAAILSFDIQDTGDLSADQIAQDPPYIQQLKTVYGFMYKSFSFYISSSYQPNEPVIYANLPSENTTMLKISRICINDKTPLLESRIDHALTCGAASTFVSVDASFFDSTADTLFVSTTHKNGEHIVCSFNMTKLNDAISNTWDECQNVTLLTVNRDCQRARSNRELQDHCYIVSRTAESYRRQACVKFGLGDAIYDNCRLHEAKINTYRYGWLENFKPVSGDVIARIGTGKVTSLLPDKYYSALFVGIKKNNNHDIHRLLTDVDNPNELNKIVWTTKTEFNSHNPMASQKDGTELIFINQTSVSSLKIDCPSLYTTCETLEQGGFYDNLGCVWCPDGEKIGALSSINKLGCTQPLTALCPPVIDHANRDETFLDWQVFGYNLDRLKDTYVLICGEKCFVNQTLSNSLKLHCSLPTEKDTNCDVKIIGNLGDYNQFIMKSPKVTSSVLLGADDNVTRSSKSSFKAWKAILAVLVVILIVFAILGLIWFARNRIKRQTERPKLDTPMNTLDPVLSIGNSYKMGDSIFDLYEHVFHNNVPPHLLIKPAEIKLEAQIGSGNFGTVYKARLMRENTSATVACKTMKRCSNDTAPRCSEFISEGLVLTNFDHENVIKLIGMAYDEGSPIIVIEYMEHQDLYHYLRQENYIELRAILKFATNIADGMAHIHAANYIHRDLAARNCTIDSNFVVKITDFGLCREVDTDRVYIAQDEGRRLPVRWMPLEAMDTQHFEKSGDVWAYGVLMWELMTRCLTPYEGMSLAQLKEFLAEGKRLEAPTYCPLIIYERAMNACWNAAPELRPTFDELSVIIREIIAEMESEESQRKLLNAHYERLSDCSVTPVRSSATSLRGNGTTPT